MAPITISIPAAYLEDARSALVEEINQGSKAVTSDQEAILTADRPEWAETRRADLASAVRLLHADMSLLEQLLDADGDTKLTGDQDAIGHVFEAITRVLSSHLDVACGYAPIDMGAVLELSAAMRWAADQAIRIEPTLDDRKAA